MQKNAFQISDVITFFYSITLPKNKAIDFEISMHVVCMKADNIYSYLLITCKF